MPLRSVLDIDVNDQKFRAFLALFEKYQTALSKMPANWGKIDAAIAGAGSGFGDMTAALLAQAELIRRVDRESRDLGRTVSGSVRGAFRGVATEVERIGRSVGETTRSLLRWTGISGIFGGLLGVGSLWGLDRLAAGGTALQTQSLGLGVNPNQLLALRNTYGTYFNVDTGLGNVRDLEASLNPMLGILGVQRTGDIVRDYRAAADRIRQLARATDPNVIQMQPWWGAATRVMSPQEIFELRNMSPKQYAQLQQRYGQFGNQGYGLSQGVLDAARDVTQALRQTGTVLEYNFLAALKPIVPRLSDLSLRLGDAVASFLKGPGFANLVDLASSGLQELGNWIASPEFKQDLQSFASDIAALAQRTRNALELLGIIGPKTAETSSPNSIFRPFSPTKAIAGAFAGGAAGGLVAGAPGALVGGTVGFFAAGTGFGGNQMPINQALNLIAQYENNNKPTGKNLNSSASGAFQIIDETWHRYAAGIPGASQYAHAQDAPYAVQRAVAAQIYRREGWRPWSSNQRLMSALGAGQQAAAVGSAELASFVGRGPNDPQLRAFVRQGAGLDPQTAAWCAAFANAYLASQGLAGSGSNVATDFETWGRAVAPGNAQAGDIIVIPRGRSPGQTGGHVGVATGQRWGDMIGMISGNAAGNRVEYSWENPASVMVRRSDQTPAHVTVTANNNTGGSSTLAVTQQAIYY